MASGGKREKKGLGKRKSLIVLACSSILVLLCPKMVAPSQVPVIEISNLLEIINF